jgi:hypothetical protein
MLSRVLEPLNRRLMMANYNDPFEALFAFIARSMLVLTATGWARTQRGWQ